MCVPQGSGLGISSILALAAFKCVRRLLSQCDAHLRPTAMGEDSAPFPTVLSRDLNAVLAIEQMLTTCGGWQDQIGAGVFVFLCASV